MLGRTLQYSKHKMKASSQKEKGREREREGRREEGSERERKGERESGVNNQMRGIVCTSNHSYSLTMATKIHTQHIEESTVMATHNPHGRRK